MEEEVHGIVIIGGGICGLATALALHRKGISSLVLEKSETLRADGAAIGVLANGWRALDQLGVAAELRETATLITADCEATVTFWGQRAKDFDDEYVYEKGQKNPIPILFVGVLMKRYGHQLTIHQPTDRYQMWDFELLVSLRVASACFRHCNDTLWPAFVPTQ